MTFHLFSILTAFSFTLISTFIEDCHCSAGFPSDVREAIVVAGNFSIDGEILNVAQYDLSSNRWSKLHKADLYVYGRSNGVVWDISVNESVVPNLMYMVGTFDTSSKTSQIQYCSVSEYDGQAFSKVGEGLCPRGSDSFRAVDLRASIISPSGDLFVGGTFESRVWDGGHFVNVYHVARFEGEVKMLVRRLLLRGIDVCYCVVVVACVCIDCQ